MTAWRNKYQILLLLEENFPKKAPLKNPTLKKTSKAKSLSLKESLKNILYILN